MIDVSNVSKKVLVSNVELTILDSLSLKVEAGESLAVIGPSGSGKSTLLGIMAGLDVPSTGAVSIAGINITDMSEEGRAGVRTEHVGFVFQSFHLLQSLTALENVSLPLELKSSSEPQSTATQYLERVGLEHRMHHYPRQLSGGEQQRVALARAFACRPNILFADEPTGNLDVKSGKEVINLFQDLCRNDGISVLMVTHDPLLASMADRMLLLKDGVTAASDIRSAWGIKEVS